MCQRKGEKIQFKSFCKKLTNIIGIQGEKMIFVFKGRPKQLRTFKDSDGNLFYDIKIYKAVQFTKNNKKKGSLLEQVDVTDDDEITLTFSEKTTQIGEEVAYKNIDKLTVTECNRELATKALLKVAREVIFNKGYDAINSDFIVGEVSEVALISNENELISGRCSNILFSYRMHTLNGDSKYCDFGVLFGCDNEIIQDIKMQTEDFGEINMFVADLYDPFEVANALSIDIKKNLLSTNNNREKE